MGNYDGGWEAVGGGAQGSWSGHGVQMRIGLVDAPRGMPADHDGLILVPYCVSMVVAGYGPQRELRARQAGEEAGGRAEATQRPPTCLHYPSARLCPNLPACTTQLPPSALLGLRGD